ncbi:hypothetical protein C8F01DRAFT_270120 [Mycena amicta]|nr:hypothetical protein C8F01DRAFT_270120 [Mycena amicta]
MLFNLKSLLFVASMSSVLVCSAADAAKGPVFTATQVYNTIVDHAPFMVQATRTITWTASPSTTIAQPTGPGI